jgi:hypothetical protein
MVKVIWDYLIKTANKVFFGVWLGLGWLIFLAVVCYCWLCENNKSLRGERFRSTVLWTFLAAFGLGFVIAISLIHRARFLNS